MVCVWERERECVCAGGSSTCVGCESQWQLVCSPFFTLSPLLLRHPPSLYLSVKSFSRSTSFLWLFRVVVYRYFASHHTHKHTRTHPCFSYLLLRELLSFPLSVLMNHLLSSETDQYDEFSRCVLFVVEAALAPFFILKRDLFWATGST